jgi:hypothetical protein
MRGRKDITELAALLDGELDSRRAEELYARLEADAGLRAEYDRQREVKLLLCELPQAEVSSYNVTRVVGEIAARRARVAASRWRALAAGFGGITVCLLLVAAALFFRGPSPPGLVARGPGERPTALGSEALGERGLRLGGGEVLPFDDWRDFTAPAGADEGAADFLRFANEAHGYSRMVNAGSGMTPDLPTAILVLDGKIYIIESDSLEELGETLEQGEK